MEKPEVRAISEAFDVSVDSDRRAQRTSLPGKIKLRIIFFAFTLTLPEQKKYI